MPSENTIMIKLMMAGAVTVSTSPKLAKLLAEIAEEVERLQKEHETLVEACELLLTLESEEVHEADTRWKQAKKTIRSLVENHQKGLTDE